MTKIIATRSSLDDVAAHLRLNEPAYRRAVELANLEPGRAVWVQYIDRFLTATGTLLVVAGIAAFFAWNWVDLGHLAKFALLEGGIVIAAVFAWYFRLDSLAGRSSLFAAAFLAGLLLAVFGQIYQTGADPYGLFLTWAMVVLPLAIIGRQAGLWVLFQALLNLTVILYYTQVLNAPDDMRLFGPLAWLAFTVLDSTLASYLFALNAAALVVWEIAASRDVPWMQGRLFPRLFAFLAFGTVLVPTLVIVIAAGFEINPQLSLVSPLLLVLAIAVCLYYYQYRRMDLFMLTCCLFATILVITAFAIRHLLEGLGGFGALLPIAVFVIAQVAAAAWWLRGVARRQESGA